MTLENSKELEDIKSEINPSRKKAEKLKENVEDLRYDLMDDIHSSNIGEYFAEDNGHEKLTTVKQRLDEFGAHVKETFGVAAHIKKDQIEQLIGFDEETAEKLAETGSLYEEAIKELENTAREYVSQMATRSHLAQVNNEDPVIYGERNMEDLLSKDSYDDEFQEYRDSGRMAPVDRLALVGENLEEASSTSYSEPRIPLRAKN